MSDQPKPETRSYFAAVADFEAGTDDPRKFLERCIETIEALDADVEAFVETNFDGARIAADEAAARWKAGSTLSPIDGMPIGIKDIMETADMATEQGSPLFRGWRGGRDSAVVASLRELGAVILGKTVTTEFAATHPNKTKNPWDLTRTPGGSSSGSAAAVGCGMLPAALGTQVIGSILRPSGFCGAFGYKPSVGGINRGGSFDEFSQSCTGTIAASLAETWTVARLLARTAGGDPGYGGITGPIELPAAKKPARLALLETDGWERASANAKAQLMSARDRLAAAGVEIVTRADDPAVAAAADAIKGAMPLSMSINAWEGRWPLNTYARDMDETKLSDTAHTRLAQANAMSQDEFIALLAERRRVRGVWAEMAGRVDGAITLTAPGAAPVGLGSTGDPMFVVPGSLLGVPALALPVLEDEGLPLGLQLLGFIDRDAELFAVAGGILAVMGR